MNPPDTRFAQRARKLYRAAAHQLDPLTSAQLRAARLRALAAPRAGARPGTRWLVPAGAFAAMAFAAVMWWQPLTQLPPHPTVAPSGMAGNADADPDLPPDADQADPALYQNLDFYGWLAANDRPTGNR